MKVIYFFLAILILNFPIVFADELLITLRDDDIILDGKWSHATEWKKSSETIIKQDNQQQFALRYAHNYEKIFVFIDVINDNSTNTLEDKSVLCFESKTNENTSIVDKTTYCFEMIFNGTLVTLVKNTETSELEYKKIDNSNNTLAMSGISDQYDRYSKTSHISYEFQIPIDVIGRSDVYNFYVAVFDGETNKITSWPQNSEAQSFITNSETWGQMISPDKSIPEFPIPIVVLMVLISIIIVQFKTNSKLVIKS